MALPKKGTERSSVKSAANKVMTPRRLEVSKAGISDSKAPQMPMVAPEQASKIVDAPMASSKRGTSIDESDAILVDLSTSCTQDVAVTKLLGWMRGPIRRKYVEMTQDGIPIDQMAYLHTLESSIADQLTEFRAAAQRRLFEAFENEADDDTMNVHIAEVNKCDDTIYKAAQYMRDIDDELGKGQNSSLQIDTFKTQQTGERHITLSTLNKWAIAKYGIAVVEDYPIANIQPEESAKQLLPLQKVESSFDEAMLNRSQETAYASFGLLMVAYAASNADCVIAERLDVTKIANRIVDQLETTLKHPILGQSAENIRKTFARSIQAMEGKLKLARSDHQSYLRALVADYREAQRK